MQVSLGKVIKIDSLLSHFGVMIGPYGFYQHATGKQPLLREGYCVDDNARAVQFLVYLQYYLPDKSELVETYLQNCWRFLGDAYTMEGTYHNFRSAEGVWLTHDVSEDMYARLARAYAMVLRYDTDQSRQQQAQELLTDLLQYRLSQFTAPRAVAEVAVALAVLPPELWARLPVQSVVQGAMQKLEALWQANASKEWPWFEPQLTYANAMLPHGLLAAQQRGVAVSADILQKSTDFLLQSTMSGDMFTPIGNYGWYSKGQPPARYDQQPIEAGTQFDFLFDYYHAFPNQITLEQVAAPYLWFIGYNGRQLQMVDWQDYSCMDGLLEAGLNNNHGGESLLAWLWSEIRLQLAPAPIREYIQRKKSQAGL